MKKQIYSAAAAVVFSAAVLLSGTGVSCEQAEELTESSANIAADDENAAVTINGTDHSLAEFNYYFNSWYSSFAEDNAVYLSYMFDESKSLKEQEYEDGRSWFDFFTDEAAASMQQILTLAEEAKKAGISITGPQQKQIDQVLEAASGFAGTLGMETEEYLKQFYGEGMTTELFTKCLTDARLAEAYTQQVRESFVPADDELETFYRDHIRDYTTVKYERFFARASAMGTVATPEQMQEAEHLARVLYAQVSGGADLKTAAESCRDQGMYYSFDDARYLEGSVYGDWLFDSGRQAGDLYLVEDVNGWYVMVFHERNEADYLTTDVMDAFFPLDPSLGSTDEQMEDSCLRAEAFLKKWEEGGADAKAFESLAAGQADESGREYVYSSAVKGTFDSSISRWIFDPQRSAGDCEVLYSEEGFHVVYYKGTSEPAWKALARDGLREQVWQERFDGLMETSDIVRNEEVLEHAGGY